MEERKCTNCGTVATPNDRFCPNCGQVLADQPGAATGGAFIPPPPPAPVAPLASDATMMSFVPPPEKAQGAFTPPPAFAGNTAFVPPPENAQPMPVRQDPVVPPPPSFSPAPDSTLVAGTPPPPPAAATPTPNRPASVFTQQSSATIPPARQAGVFGQPASSTPPPPKPTNALNQPPAGIPLSSATRPPYRPPQRSVPPAQSLPPSSKQPVKNSTGLIIGGCAALAIILIGIILVVVLVLIPSARKVTGIVTPVAKGTPAVKTTGKTATPAVKTVKTATPKKAVTTSAEIKAAIATGALLYSDDFSDASSGWDTWATDNSKVGYVSGKYVIEALKTDSFFWANPGKDFSDFVLEIDATKQAGPDNNGFGVIFRYVDDKNFYRFDMSSDGYYAFGYYENDNWTSLVEWTEASVIKQGNATNTITILCKGNKFTFYINGTKITDVTDGTLTSGDIGLWAGTVSEAGVKIAFDRLGVWKTK